MCAIYNSTQVDYNVQSMHKSQDKCTRHRYTIMSRIKTTLKTNCTTYNLTRSYAYTIMYNSQDNCTIYNSTQAYNNVQNQDNVQLSRQRDMCAIYNSTQTYDNVQNQDNSAIHNYPFAMYNRVYQQSFCKCLCVDATMDSHVTR